MNSVCSVSGWPVALATPKSITFGTGSLVVLGHQHVRRLDVAVDDPLLMGVLDRLADRHEQLQPLARRQLLLVAVLRDRHALDQFHDEVRPAARRVVPASSTLAMFGWSISASACRSASNRAITCRVSIPGLMIFERDPALDRLASARP